DYIFNLTSYIAVFTFTLFFCSFSDRILNNNVRINLLEIIIVFIIFSTISCSTIFNYIFSTSIYKLVSFIIIPIFIYILLTVKKILSISEYSGRDKFLLAKNSINLCWKNRIPTFYFLIILIFALLPIMIYYYH